MSFITHNGKYVTYNNKYVTIQNAPAEYLEIDQTILYFDYNGNACTTGSIWVSSNIEWYATVDTGEITSAYIYPTYRTGDGAVTFYCGETNYDMWAHASQVDFYRTSDDQWMAGCGIVQQAYGETCA